MKKLFTGNLNGKLEKLQTLSNNAIAVFGDMINDLVKANENLNDVAAKADVIVDEHISIAKQARTKIQNNEDVIEKISKIIG